MVHISKRFLLFPGLLGFPLNMCFSRCPPLASFHYNVVTSVIFLAPGMFYKFKITMDPNLMTERVRIEVACFLRCPVNSFTSVSFTTVDYWENAFWAAGAFLAAIPQVATGINWKQCCALSLSPVLIY